MDNNFGHLPSFLVTRKPTKTGKNDLNFFHNLINVILQYTFDRT